MTILIYIAIFAAGATLGMVVTCFFAANKVQRLECEIVGLRSCLVELVDVVDNGGEVDSFTTQPARKFLGLAEDKI